MYCLPDNNPVLSSLKPNSHDCRSGFIHIDLKHIKCPLRKCNQHSKSHCLVKSESNCIHTLLCKLIRGEGDLQKNGTEKSQESVLHHFSKQKTSQHLIEQIICCIPSPLEMEKEKIFLQNSYDFQVSVFQSRDISKCDNKLCDKCFTKTTMRYKKPGNSYLATPGFLIEIPIHTFVCKQCELLLYPDVIKYGLIPISDSLIVSWSYLIDGRNQIKSGAKLYNYFKSSLRRLALENRELSKKINKIDFHNYSVRLSKCAVAYNSAVLINCPNDIDSLSNVLCLHCGLIPTVLSSDGNAKNTIYLNRSCENLVFDKDDDSEILSLNTFLTKCVTAVIGTSLFQNFKKETINVFKIPPVMSNKLCSVIRNREAIKKSVFLKTVDLTKVDFNEVTRIVTSNEFNVLQSRSLDLRTVRDLARKIKIPGCGKLSKIMLENIIIELFECLVAGVGNCHGYNHVLGQTGGWTDSWCPHSVKYGSKMMVLQESVVDPCDIFLSLKYQPTLQILDDPCTFMAHIFCTEPDLSKLLFGKNRGCFEAPHKTQTPKSNHDCPELLPLPYNHRKVDRSALENPCGKVHPNSGKIPRKVLGTKLSESHKKHNECSFHNINLCLQADHIKVLLQGVRKTWNATLLLYYHCCQ